MLFCYTPLALTKPEAQCPAEVHYEEPKQQKLLLELHARIICSLLALINSEDNELLGKTVKLLLELFVAVLHLEWGCGEKVPLEWGCEFFRKF